MSQNSEQIEAKLCAYLEGELDEQGLAEIEKHLESNPAHRKLLAEVGKTRGLLRALPREPAPPDICEAFQGQLERSVLLSNLDARDAASGLRTNRWPQYLAVAAIVLLAAGLGLVVYFGLPSGRTDQNYAIGGAGGGGIAPSATSTRSGDEFASKSELTSATGTAGATRGVAPAGQVPEALAKKPDAGLAVPPAASTAPVEAEGRDLTVLARRVQGSWDTTERGKLFAAGGSPSDERTDETLKVLASVPPKFTCFVVTSAKPAATTEKIGQKLSTLQVAWSAVPRPDTEALQSKLDTYAVAGVATPVATAVPAINQPSGDVVADADSAPAVESPASRPESAIARRGGAVGGLDQGNERDAAGEARPSQDLSGNLVLAQRPRQAPAPARGPSTRPSGDEAENEVAPPGQGLAARAHDYGLNVPAAGRPETLIVARNLTAAQAAELRTSIADGGVEQQLELQQVVSAAPARPGPADAPAQPQRPTADSILSEAPGAAASVVPTQREAAAGVGAPADRGFKDGVDAAPGPAGGLTARKESVESPPPVSRARGAVALRSQQMQESTQPAAPAAPSSGAPSGRDVQADRGETYAIAPGATREPSGAPGSATALSDAERRAPVEVKRAALAPAAAATGPAPDRVDVVIVVRGYDDSSVTPPATANDPPDAAGTIGKLDTLTLQFGEGDSDSADVRVGEDGTVDVPRVGRVKAEGLTAGELEKVIAEKSRAAAGPAEPGKGVDVRVKRQPNAGADSAAPPARRVEQPPKAPAPAGTPAPAEPAPGTNAQPIKSE